MQQQGPSRSPKSNSSPACMAYRNTCKSLFCSSKTEPSSCQRSLRLRPTLTRSLCREGCCLQDGCRDLSNGWYAAITRSILEGKNVEKKGGSRRQSSHCRENQQLLTFCWWAGLGEQPPCSRLRWKETLQDTAAGISGLPSHRQIKVTMGENGYLLVQNYLVMTINPS